MKAFSPEWYAREKAWQDECNRNYEAAAAELVDQGYSRGDHKNGFYPATFHKPDQPETVLVRKLGSSNWYPTKR